MKNFLILLLKGILIGIGKIIPGVSGAMIAISLGVYERGLKIISNVFKDLSKNISFIIPVGTGLIIGIALFSNIIITLLSFYYLPTMLLFIGLIVGGIKSVKIDLHNKKNIIIFTITLMIIFFLSFMKQENNQFSASFISMIGMGFVEAISMIVPGLSGTAILMMLGYYNLIINAFGELNINVLFPFIVGIIFGVIVISKIINYFFLNYRDETNTVIYGLAVSSVVILFFQTMNNNYDFLEILISLFLFVIGYNISKRIEN